MIKAIETKYKGYRFRSRLEARWAVFFDSIGVEWAYEPEGFETTAGWYLPDFRLTYRGDPACPEVWWAEVKASADNLTDVELGKAMAFGGAVGGRMLLLVGVPSLTTYKRLPRCGDGELMSLEHIRGSRGSPDFGYVLASHKNRPWFDESQNIFTESDDTSAIGPALSLLTTGVAAARSARFEFGDTPK